MIAIDQGGSEIPRPAQTRMYIYPETDKRLLHLITVGEKGEKKEQAKDIKLAHDYVDQLKKESENG